MASPTNSREWDMPTEDFYSDLSSLLVSPRWSPPRYFLPSSNEYSIDNPPQNQEHNPASNMGFEESEEMMMSCFYFPPSPPSFPLCPPMPNVFFVTTQRYINFALSCQHLLEEKIGALHVIKDVERHNIWKLLFDGYKLRLHNNWDKQLDENNKDVKSLVDNILDEDNNEDVEATLRRMNWLEQHDEDIVEQPVFEVVGVRHQLIQNRGGELDLILGRGVLTVNGLELSERKGLPTSPETLLICQAKFSFRVWLGHGGQWAAEIRLRCNRLNIGSFTTVEDAISTYELVLRWRGRVDPTCYPGLFENENTSKLPLQSPPPTQEVKRNDEIEAVGTSSEGIGDCVMADKGRLNSGCLGKRKTKEKNPRGGERRNKNPNGVRIAIPLEDILQTKGMRLKEAANHLRVTIPELKSSCQDYGIRRWPPRNEHKLIRQSLPSETPAVDDQEGFPQSTSHNGPSYQASTATVDTNSVNKEIPLSQFLRIAQQENLDAVFGNDEEEAIGMEVEGMWEGVMEEAQLNSRCLGLKGIKKVNTLGGEGGNNITTGVRIAITMEDILKVKGMPLNDAAEHLEISRSTLKRVCREYGIKRWPPRKEHEIISQTQPNESPTVEHELISQTRPNVNPSVEHELSQTNPNQTRPNEPPAVERELISQTRPNESPAVVGQERISQLNSVTLLPFTQVSANIGTNNVTILARYEEVRIKFRLSWPWGMVGLEQQVKMRLPLEAGAYYIKYKDEDDGLTLIACDEDLEGFISSSSQLGTHLIEVFLEPKVAHEFRVNRI